MLPACERHADRSPVSHLPLLLLLCVILMSPALFRRLKMHVCTQCGVFVNCLLEVVAFEDAKCYRKNLLSFILCKKQALELWPFIVTEQLMKEDLITRKEAIASGWCRKPRKLSVGSLPSPCTSHCAAAPKCREKEQPVAFSPCVLLFSWENSYNFLLHNKQQKGAHAPAALAVAVRYE